jgi:spore maturation protein CgeB
MSVIRYKGIRYPKFIRLKHALFPSSLKKIRPLPLTIAKPMPEKSLLTEIKIYDLSFIARIPSGISLTYRNHLLRKLSKYVRHRQIKAYIRPLIGSYRNAPRLSYSKYMKIIAKSWMSISCRGLGFDTYRFWEIPYAGAVLVSEEPKIVIPNNFTDGKNAIFFSSSKELCKKLDYYIGNYDVLKTIARNGREHLLKYHTPMARAKYIINELKNMNG